MRIKHAYIYGFGKWKDAEIHFSDHHPFIFVSGRNESGKTTLRKFFLFMLFGLQPKQRLYYMPKTGGQMGGRLTITLPEVGDCTIERLHDRNNGEATCYLREGQVYDEEWLKTQLNGMNRQTFSSIFSFDSNELHHIRQIKSEELGNVLLGVGMTGTEQIYESEKWLNQEISQIFKPQGKKPVMNKILVEVETIHEKLKMLEEKEKTFNEKLLTMEELSNRIQELTDNWNQATVHRDKLEKQLHAYPQVQKLYDLLQQAKQYPSELTFPENGLQRYQHVKDQMLPIKSEMTIVEGNRTNTRQEIEKVHAQLLSSDTIDDLKTMVNKLPDYQRLRDEQQYKRQEKQQLHNELLHELKKLEINLSVDDVSDIFFPFHIEDLWNELKDESMQIQSETEKINADLAMIDEQMALLEGKKSLLKEQAIDSERIEEQRNRLKQFAKAESIREADQLQHNQSKKLMSLYKRKSKSATRLFIIGIALSVIVSIIAIFLSIPYVHLFSVITILFVIVQKMVTDRSARSIEALLLHTKQVEGTANAFDEREMREIEETIQKQEKLYQQIEQIEHQWNQLQISRLKLEERKSFFDQKDIQLERRIDEQKKQYPFLKSITVDYWSILYHHLKKCVSLSEKITTYTKDIERTSIEIEAFEKEIDVTLTDGLIFEPDIDIQNKLDNMKNVYERQLNLQNKLQQHEEWLDQIQSQIEMLQNKLKPYQDEMNQLWQLADVTDEESYLIKGKRYKEKVELEQKIQDYSQQLSHIFDQLLLQLLQEKGQIDQWEIEANFKQAKEEVEQIFSELEESRQQLSDVKSLINHMENAEDFSIMKHHYHTKREELYKIAKQWAVYQVAKEKLMHAKKMYQQNFLPKIMDQTTMYFAMLTDQEYRKVYPPVDGNGLQVENRMGIRFQVDELSQGTKDQLYISLRIALSEITSKKNKMPFFMDDAFVHFDKDRRKQMLEVLLEVSENQQVLLFTCDDSLHTLVNNKKVMIENI
ncbi:AAA family ATPase [Aquibacillus koreensis]|uniref:AAA family ATPase n=1 Tax=Aquibacillus koreensis TaxID=279446 RepID=A0A9X4AJ74_9BACI|nr:AAA family ATPase [Aquibacillus koreensis]MCT2535555.1 AAA family ATPase [Aquibacillus koreensis]MDC3420160.1 AAA family ATPase [Aquibacillus koreensis]